MIGEYCNEKMNIEKGKIYRNRTLYYLAPALKLYGDEFTTKYKTLAGLATGLGHKTLDKDNNIYCLFDVNGKMKFDAYLDKKQSRLSFTFLLNYFRNQPYYIKDYPYDSGMFGHKHMIVLKNPVNNLNDFLAGNYSKLYNKEQLDKLFQDKIVIDKKEIDNVTKLILNKNKQFKSDFLNNLNKTFNTNLQLKDVDDNRELDFPPNLQNEIFE